MGSLLAIKINERPAHAPHVQEILTHYGCNIRTRVGFHETNEDNCSMDGLLILQMCGDKDEIQAMYDDLEKVEGVIPRFIEF